ncbi:MAG: DUF998 domain-containing protein [Candidatus Lokiarchaeota archaeon]|nr:DUF998 domain-containing protein [Candidatus Lokiarchaeota archaeon]MBD3342306.1 DUF998 domain-containing protein [Candidatus Lokiarchaeota archaeon]
MFIIHYCKCNDLRILSNELYRKLFDLIPPGIYGLLSIVLCSIFIIVSYSNFPGYNMIENDVSVLGIGPGISAPLFNIGIISTGIVLILFYCSLRYSFFKELTNLSMVNKVSKSSVISSVALALIGCFPVVNFTIGLIHALLALIFFGFCCISMIFYGLIFRKLELFSKHHAYLSFYIAAIIVFYIMTRWSIVEWIVFFSYGIWILDISIFTLKKT